MKTTRGISSIRSISAYRSAHDLINDYGFLPEHLSADADFCNFLRHFDDYEDRQYFCVNDNTIIVADAIDGTVFGSFSAEKVIEIIVNDYEENEK